MRKTKFCAKSSGGIKSVLSGVLIIWCTFLLLSLSFSVILFSGDDPTRSTSLVSIGSFVLSGAIGTLINRKLLPSADKRTPLFSSLFTVLIYLSASAILSAGISLGAIISSLCFMGASFLVGIPKKKKVRKHSRRA